jgi:hypothetical protein
MMLMADSIVTTHIISMHKDTSAEKIPSGIDHLPYYEPLAHYVYRPPAVKADLNME